MFNREKYVCDTHKKPYERIYMSHFGPNTYYGKVMMHEDGTPIGYEKVKVDKSTIEKMFENRKMKETKGQ